MRHFVRHLPLLALAGCAALPEGSARMLANGVGCERSEHGGQARTIAIYTRVIADRVCRLDAAGRCHGAVDAGTVSAEVRLPQSRNAPPADLLRQELGRRGILARIVRPRGPKMYAWLGYEDRDDGALVLELSDIGVADGGDVAHVMVRASRATSAPEGDLVRLVRTLTPANEGSSQRVPAPVRACWRLQQRTSSALAD
jgi:hypothetical protein